jgi:predicted phosphodiesterase
MIAVRRAARAEAAKEREAMAAQSSAQSSSVTEESFAQSSSPAADALMGALGYSPVAAAVAPTVDVARAGQHPAQEISPDQDSAAVAPIAAIAQPRKVDTASNGLLLVVPDIHAPMQDEAAFGAVLSLMRSHRFAELVLLGDAVELVSCSWFGGPQALVSYKDECRVARTVLKRLLALHDGPVTLTIGNHDGRADQKVEKNAPQLHGSIVDEMRWAELGVTVVPEDAQPITRGRLRLLHGHQDSGRFPALYHARKMCDLYGLPGQAVIYGHTHKDQSHSRPMHGGPARAYGLGCLEKRPHWLKSCDAWTHSVAVADPASGIVNVLPIVDGALWYGGVRYGERARQVA